MNNIYRGTGEMIDYTEVDDGERWEAFARDFLNELGFTVESPPDRGADQGKDLLVVEQLAGHLGSYFMRWLVSCKHFATSGGSVKESDESNILERMKAFDADGFLGFYSTLPSAGLNSRLAALRKQGSMRDYRLFDGKLIENYCLRIGYSKLLLRYFPKSYRQIAPLHAITGKYLPLECHSCGRDILLQLYAEDAHAVAVVAHVHKIESDGKNHIKDVYWACKGKCDRKLERSAYETYKYLTAWQDIGDLVIPAEFLRWMFVTINRVRKLLDVYERDSWEKEVYFLTAVAQKVMREMTDRERERVGTLLELSSLGL